MGLVPVPRVPPPRRPPDRESFHLGVARAAYLAGALSTEELEEAVEHVLNGGRLTQAGRLVVPGGLPPAARDPGRPSTL